jgi:hypothetical protein
MSTFGTAFCVDAPDEADVREVHARLARDDWADPRQTAAFLSAAPGGLARLVVYLDYSTVGSGVRELVGHIGSGRLAVADNRDEFGAGWSAFRVVGGACTLVHEHEVLPVDPADHETVREYHEALLEGAPPEIRAEMFVDGWVPPRPERDPAALADLARLYEADPAVIGDAAAAADHAYEHCCVVGDSGLFPFWFACGLPWPEPGSGEQLTP